MSGRRWPVYVLAIGATLLLGRVVATAYVDYLWYRDMGAVALWQSQLGYTLLLRGALATLGTLFLFANLYAVRQSVVSVVLPRRVANLEIGEEVPGGALLAGVVLLSLALGALLTIPGQSWTALALARRGAEFNESDPYFKGDLGQFVYWLPLERGLYTWSIIALVLATATVVVLYALTSSLRWERGGLRVSTYVRRHLTALGVLLLLLLAWNYRLDGYNVLVSGGGPNGTFTSTDHRVAIPVSLALQLVAVGAALVVLWAGWTGQIRVALFTVTGVLLASLALRQLVPLLVGRDRPSVNPAARERDYLAIRAGFTRRAYDVERVRRAPPWIGYAGGAAAAAGVPVWDDPALARALGRGAAGGELEAPVAWRSLARGLAGRAVQRPPDGARGPWTVTSVLGTAADARGGPALVDAPDTRGEEGVTLPDVLVATDAGGYAVVADSTGGIAATSLRGWWSRLAHAWSLQNFRLLFGTLPYPSPRVVLRRDVRERVRALAPFLAQGEAVSPVPLADSLYWVLHLYATSSTYPLSRHTSLDGAEVSYVRHAATAVVEAHSGRVTLVADSILDPIATTWVGAYPSLFATREDLPPGLAEALPPALDLARVQGDAIATYGSREGALVEEEATGGTLRLAQLTGADSALAGPAPRLVALGDTLAATYPVVDARDRLRGIVVATGGPTAVTWWRPLDTAQAPRWATVVERLRRAGDGAGAAPDGPVERGRVVPIPLGDEVVFAQSHYVARGVGVLALSRVAVLRGDSVRVGRTLAELLGPSGATPLAEVPPGDLRRRLSAVYEAMSLALRRGDWVAFGAAYEELGRLAGVAPR